MAEKLPLGSLLPPKCYDVIDLSSSVYYGKHTVQWVDSLLHVTDDEAEPLGRDHGCRGLAAGPWP